MVVGTLSLVQKGQTSGRSRCSMQYVVHSGIVLYGGWDIVFGAKGSNQWSQYALHSGQSGIVVHGGGDIVFGAKWSNQDTECSRCSKQWAQYLHSGHCGCSGIMMYGGGDIVLGAKGQTSGCNG